VWVDVKCCLYAFLLVGLCPKCVGVSAGCCSSFVYCQYVGALPRLVCIGSMDNCTSSTEIFASCAFDCVHVRCLNLFRLPGALVTL
jgi:hypothetical protein